MSDVKRLFWFKTFISNVMVDKLDNSHSEVDQVVFLGNENKTLESRD